MPTKFSVGDLVQVDNLPRRFKNSAVWKKSENDTQLGIVVDIVESPTVFFSECLAIKISNGDIITLSPNMVKLVDA